MATRETQKIMNFLEQAPYKSLGGVTEGRDETIKNTAAKSHAHVYHQRITPSIIIIVGS